MNGYFERTFTKEETQRIRQLLNIYNSLFPYHVPLVRQNILSSFADQLDDDFANKIRKLKDGSKKYRDVLTKIYLMLGYEKAAK